MGFTVSRNGDTRDAQFVPYARLLRQQGADLGNLPRAPDPHTGRRWVYVWSDRARAEAFAEELKRRTGDGEWNVAEVSGATEGPLGPIFVQAGRRATGVVFALHPQGRALVRSVYPDAKPAPSTIELAFGAPNEPAPANGWIESAATDLMPMLTGLSADQLARLGYTIIEDDTGRTVARVPPGDLAGA